MIVIFVILFLALLSIVGGKKGILSAVSLIFAAVCVLWLYLPLMYMGVEPFLAAVLCCILITLFTLILLGGFSVKTFAAIAGTVFGCIVAGVVAFAFAHFMHITGYNVEDVENLILVEQNSQLRAGGILFSGILIASLGAVMDVAMSIASSISEIHYHSPELSHEGAGKERHARGKRYDGNGCEYADPGFCGRSIHNDDYLLCVQYAGQTADEFLFPGDRDSGRPFRNLRRDHGGTVCICDHCMDVQAQGINKKQIEKDDSTTLAGLPAERCFLKCRSLADGGKSVDKKKDRLFA